MKQHCKLAIVIGLSVWAGGQACHNPVAAKKPVSRHFIEIQKPGGMLYIDNAEARLVMQPGNFQQFVAYKIGFVDSEDVDSKAEQERTVYYDYRMSNDWKAVVGADSLTPVYYQPVVGLNKKTKEGILVFEVPEGRHPEALVYNDSYGDWQQQIIALNQIIK